MQQIKKTLYIGNGRPALTTEVVELRNKYSDLDRRLGEMSDELKSNGEKLDRLTIQLSKSVGMMVGASAILGFCIPLILKYVFKVM